MAAQRSASDCAALIADQFRCVDSNGNKTIALADLKRCMQILDPQTWSDATFQKFIDKLQDAYPKSVHAGHFVQYEDFAHWLASSHEESLDFQPDLLTRKTISSLIEEPQRIWNIGAIPAIIKGYGCLRKDTRVVVRHREKDANIAKTVCAELQKFRLVAAVQGSSEVTEEEITIWLVTPGWSKEVMDDLQSIFKEASQLILHTTGVRNSDWLPKLMVKGAAGPTIDIGMSYSSAQRSRLEDFDLLKAHSMGRLWTKIMKLQGVQAYDDAVNLCQAMSMEVVQNQTPGTDKQACQPHVVGFVGSTTFSSSWAYTLTCYFAAELMELNRSEDDKEIVVCTGGFRNMNDTNMQNQGVGYTAGLEYHKMGGHVMHILPEKANEKDWSAVAEQLRDGSFLPVDYGVTLFAGQSNDERLDIMGQVCDIMFLIEGGPGAATQAKSAMLVGGELIPVVPIRATGGAASGMFNMPTIDKPVQISPEAWDVVAGPSIDKADKIDLPDEELRRMAKAMAKITWNTMHPLAALGNVWSFASSPVASEPWVKSATETVKSKVVGNVRICILGSTKFNDPASEALVQSLAKQLDEALQSTNVVFATGGNPGVQETFTRNCGDGSRTFHIVPEKVSSNFGLGLDVQVGKDNNQRRQVFGALGDIYISIEGGPGVAQEARDAHARGAYVVPMVRTGGASGGMFEFPPDCRPEFVTEEHWAVLGDTSCPVELSAKAATEIVVNIVSERVSLPAWELPDDKYLAPLQTCLEQGNLKVLHSLLKLSEKPFRIYGQWSRPGESNVRQILGSVRVFFNQYIERSWTNRNIQMMKDAYLEKGSKFRRVYSTIVEDVIKGEAAYSEFVSVVNAVKKRVVEEHPEVAQDHDGLKGMDLMLEIYRKAYLTMGHLEDFCTKIAEKSGAQMKKAPMKRMWRSMEKILIKYSGEEESGLEPVELKDVARSSLEGNMHQLLKAFRAMTEDKDICIVRVKNRFDQPADMGWADCQVMLYFTNVGIKHICEIQLVHHQLMIVRTNMGAHKDYASVRAAGELLELFGEKVPSLSPGLGFTPYCCKAKPTFEVSMPPQLGNGRRPAWGSLQQFLDANTHASGSLITAALASRNTSQVINVALGIEDASLPLGGRVSLRWESEEFVIFDSPLCWSPLHLVAMPTAWFVPDWTRLLQKPELAKELLAKMTRALQEVTLTFLRHKEWRESFFAGPGQGLPNSLEEDELMRFIDKHAIAGFIWPRYGNQVCLQWILPPMFPWHWSVHDHFSSARWVPLEIVSARLGLDSQIERETSIVGRPGLRTMKSIRAKGSSTSDLHTLCQRRYDATQEELANWASIFEAIAMEGDCVHLWNQSGCLKHSSLKVDDVIHEDERRLSSYGYPRNGKEPVGTFYGYPKRPEEMSLEFVQNVS